MNISDQVSSIELSEKLEKLGVKQDSLFWWKWWIPSKRSTYIQNSWTLSINRGSEKDYKSISAFTAAELIAHLPPIINPGLYKLRINKNTQNVYGVGYYNMKNDFIRVDADKNLANAAAMMLIDILESNRTELSKNEL